MRGREAAQRRFNLEKVSADYNQLLESVLDKSLGMIMVAKPADAPKQRLLLLSSRPPFARDSGFKVRVFNAGVALRKAGWSVDILAVNDRPGEVFSAEDLGESCDRLFLFPVTPWSSRLNLVPGLLSRVPMQVWYYRFSAVKRWVRAHACDYSLVFANHARMAPYALTMDIPRVLDLHDSIGLNYRREMSVARSFIRRFSYFMEGRRMERYEAALPASFACTFVTSAVDRRFIEEHGGRGITVLPVAVRPEALEHRIDGTEFETAACCFIGRMSYAPNVAAVTYFAGHVFPRITAEAPGVEFRIVGADPAPAVLALQKQRGIRVAGYVESPYDMIARCAVFVAPMVSGSGVQNKILEALALQRAVVTTSLGAAGIPGLEHGVNILVADTADDFADAVLRLLKDHGLRSRLGTAGRSLIESRYTWEEIGREMVAAVNGSLGIRGGQ
jgi:glycosyltransferase involved in cell wall biosynthesis